MKALKLIAAFTVAALLSGCVVYPIGYRGGGYYGGSHYGDGHYRDGGHYRR